LADKISEYLETNSVPTVKYSLDIDEMYLKNQAADKLNVFDVGDTVNIEDTDLSINTRIKIIDFSRDILRPYKYTLTIKDTPLSNAFRRYAVQTSYIRDFMKLNGLDDPIKANTSWRSDTQILGEVPSILNDRKEVDLGRKSEKVNVGNTSGITKLFGILGIVNPFEKELKLDVGGITQDRQVGFPDRDIVVNDWNYIVGMPESFPSLSSDYGLTGAQNEINKVFTTSEPFVSGSTIVYLNGVRQFRGTNEDYTETADNEITFALAPYADDRIIVDYQKL